MLLKPYHSASPTARQHDAASYHVLQLSVAGSFKLSTWVAQAEASLGVRRLQAGYLRPDMLQAVLGVVLPKIKAVCSGAAAVPASSVAQTLAASWRGAIEGGRAYQMTDHDDRVRLVVPFESATALVRRRHPQILLHRGDCSVPVHLGGQLLFQALVDHHQGQSRLALRRAAQVCFHDARMAEMFAALADALQRDHQGLHAPPAMKSNVPVGKQIGS
jgi:hypothetical protein